MQHSWRTWKRSQQQYWQEHKFNVVMFSFREEFQLQLFAW